MAECKVCGEKIVEGQVFCSVCAPEHASSATEEVRKSVAPEEEIISEERKNKVEIKKELPIAEGDVDTKEIEDDGEE